MKKTAIFFIDAFKPEYITKENTPFLYEFAKNNTSLKLESLLGYSAGIHPSMWTGTYQQTHNKWTHYYYNPKIDISEPLLLKIQKNINSLKLRRLFKASFTLPFAILKKLTGYSIDFNNKFQYPLSFQELGMGDIKFKTLFEVFDEKRIKYDPTFKTHYMYDPIEVWENIIISNNDVELFGTYTFDHLGHISGTKSKEIKNKLKILDEIIKNIIEKIKKKEQININEINIFIFSDHGMTDVIGHIDIERILYEYGFIDKREFISLYDSTMARFWINTKNKHKNQKNNIKKDLSNCLENIKLITLIDDTLKEKYKINFKDNQYGDIICLADPGVLIFPNSFQSLNIFRSFTKAMHGYKPEDENSYGIFISNCINTNSDTLNIVDILPTICTSLNLRIPSTCEGMPIQNR